MTAFYVVGAWLLGVIIARVLTYLAGARDGGQADFGIAVSLLWPMCLCVCAMMLPLLLALNFAEWVGARWVGTPAAQAPERPDHA